ncbi:NRT1/ PTR family 4.3-like protein [Tanacetum coccineum]|uniref:NRT1/ PTR family 4.3-like protein n=1 Tax=Tanacetum coccineum TaxID=301880 RepID=A0ABQ5DSI9_9ASTR
MDWEKSCVEKRDDGWLEARLTKPLLKHDLEYHLDNRTELEMYLSEIKDACFNGMIVEGVEFKPVVVDNGCFLSSGVQAFEIMAIAAVSNNLIIYAINEMNFSLSKAANIVTMLYRTLTYLPQLKPPRCNMLTDGDRCIEAMEVEALIFFLPLYLVALGNGCMKHNMLAHGADQFNKSDS